MKHMAKQDLALEQIFSLTDGDKPDRHRDSGICGSIRIPTREDVASYWNAVEVRPLMQ
jgi:hypothetical protein